MITNLIWLLYSLVIIVSTFAILQWAPGLEEFLSGERREALLKDVSTSTLLLIERWDEIEEGHLDRASHPTPVHFDTFFIQSGMVYLGTWKY